MANQIQQNKKQKPQTYQESESNWNNWANRAAVALAMKNANAATNGGYLLGSIFRKPFQKWVSQLWGVPQEDSKPNPNNSDFNFVTPLSGNSAAQDFSNTIADELKLKNLFGTGE